MVSGGCNERFRTRTVEVYDHVADDWSILTRMNAPRTNHSMVAVRSKLFVFGGETCEVFDSVSGKFANLQAKAPMLEPSKCVQIGSKVILFKNKSTVAYVYDIDEGELKTVECEVTRIIYDYCCVRVPKL